MEPAGRKAFKVIISCEKVYQLEVAEKYVIQAHKAKAISKQARIDMENLICSMALKFQHENYQSGDVCRCTV